MNNILLITWEVEYLIHAKHTISKTDTWFPFSDGRFDNEQAAMEVHQKAKRQRIIGRLVKYTKELVV